MNVVFWLQLDTSFSGQPEYAHLGVRMNNTEEHVEKMLNLHQQASLSLFETKPPLWAGLDVPSPQKIYFVGQRLQVSFPCTFDFVPLLVEASFLAGVPQLRTSTSKFKTTL
jgi:hypothetical protein